jgi:hypothetical protein
MKSDPPVLGSQATSFFKSPNQHLFDAREILSSLAFVLP